jgi:hypothetical protein
VTVYYTFRLLSQTPVRVECCKWDDNNRPTTYTVYPDTDSCSCVATKRDCKHVVLAKAMIKPNFINEMHLWKWDEKNSWTEVNDMTPMEDILEVVFTS